MPGKFHIPSHGTIAASALLDMAARKHHAGLESFEDMEFQRRTWLVERVGWVVIAAILLAAMLGLFGGGGVVASAETATEDGSLSMRYDRFWRFQSPAQLRVVARSPDERAATLRIWLGREYVEAVRLSSITPQPERVEAAADRFIFEFALAEPGQSSALVFNTEPAKRWRVRGRLGIEGGGTLSFSQFVYP